MKQYSYFPGCSSSEGGSKAYGLSTLAVSKALDTELAELEDWNCCGSTPYSSASELSSLCLAARNLSIAEKTGRNLVTPCSSCYVILNRTNAYLKQYPRLGAEVAEALSASGLKYKGTVKVRHLLDVYVNDIGYDAVKARVTRNLDGLKVAAYYGCQVVRPKPSFDHPECPESLEKLVSAIGAQPVSFPLKARCCGGSLIIPEEDMVLGLMNKILRSVAKSGADCIVTVCPLCQMNLDAYQSQVNRKLGTNYKLPVLFFTQLMGVAFGLSETELGLETSIVRPGKVLAKYL